MWNNVSDWPAIITIFPTSGQSLTLLLRFVLSYARARSRATNGVSIFPGPDYGTIVIQMEDKRSDPDPKDEEGKQKILGTQVSISLHFQLGTPDPHELK